MPQAAVDEGVTLEYDTVGSGEPIVCIHGAFIANSFTQLLVEPRLAGYQRITYRRRGYGGSSLGPMPGSIERQAADCRRLLDQLRLERAHIVGHSLGGAIALQLALDSPEAVQSLTLLEPAMILGEGADAYRESLRLNRLRAKTLGDAAILDEFMVARWPAYTHAVLDSVVPGGFAQAVVDARATFEVDFDGLLNWSFDELAASKVTQPALVVLGGASESLGPRFPETYRWLLDRLPASAGFVLPEATHFLHMEDASQSRTLAEVLDDFLSRHPTDG
ncbi:MAG: alpha/beta fold hydrolase [Dehalococcoidia bacterium]